MGDHSNKTNGEFVSLRAAPDWRRARSISGRAFTKKELLEPKPPEELWNDRPQTRGECQEGPRPCPYASCRFHLYLDIHPISGSIKLNFPHLEIWQLKETCALDVADKGGVTLEEIGELTNVVRERVRQIVVKALVAVRSSEVELDGEPREPLEPEKEK